MKWTMLVFSLLILPKANATLPSPCEVKCEAVKAYYSYSNVKLLPSEGSDNYCKNTGQLTIGSLETGADLPNTINLASDKFISWNKSVSYIVAPNCQVPSELQEYTISQDDLNQAIDEFTRKAKKCSIIRHYEHTQTGELKTEVIATSQDDLFKTKNLDLTSGSDIRKISVISGLNSKLNAETKIRKKHQSLVDLNVCR